MADRILCEKESLLIHMDTDIQMKLKAMSGLQDFLRENKIKFFGFSSTMTTGCDISDIGPIDMMMMFVASGSVAWQDTWQMLLCVCVSLNASSSSLTKAYPKICQKCGGKSVRLRPGTTSGQWSANILY